MQIDGHAGVLYDDNNPSVREVHMVKCTHTIILNEFGLSCVISRIPYNAQAPLGAISSADMVMVVIEQV